jgi:superfamily II DNA or RNA helicase
MQSGFFEFWKRKRFEMLKEGFTVYKDESTGKWFLYETQLFTLLFKKSFNQTSPTAPPPPPEVKFELPPYTIKNKDGLRVWQVDAAGQLVSAIKHWGAAFDGSEMGVGKTYTACGTVRELNVPFVIVCPKPVIHQWEKVIKNHFQLDKFCRGIINYELLIRGRTDSTIASFILNRKANRRHFTWKIPKNSVIIWDEAHRLKNFTTKNSKTCIEAYKQGYNQLFLSATLASSPLDLRTVGTCTKLFKGGPDFYRWAYEHGVSKGMWGLEFNNDENVLKRIHTYLFKHRGTRLQRDVIPTFPETEIIVDVYNIDEENTKKIRAIYDEMKKELKVLDTKIKHDGDSEMAIRIRALQKTEMLKVPLMEEMINDGIEAGMSVVVFLNYSDSIDALASRLNTKCIYDGRNPKERQQYIELFQTDQERVLITNIAAAREGLNLGDETGKHPRLSIISPNDSVQKIKQALGRIHRENSKTKSIQKLLYIADTQEEAVVDNVGVKLSNLTLINNGVITDDDLKI